MASSSWLLCLVLSAPLGIGFYLTNNADPFAELSVILNMLTFTLACVVYLMGVNSYLGTPKERPKPPFRARYRSRKYRRCRSLPILLALVLIFSATEAMAGRCGKEGKGKPWEKGKEKGY